MVLENLEVLIDDKRAELEKAHSELQDRMNLVTLEGIEANVSFSWGGVRIAVKHSELNWTEFVTINFERNRRSDNQFEFRFSHGSGGWNEADVDEILQATQDIFTVTRSIKKVLEKSLTMIEEAMTLENEISALYDDRETIVKQNAEYAKIAEVEADHFRVTEDNVIELIIENKHLPILIISGKTSYESSLSDKGRSRRSFFIGDRGVGKNDLIRYVQSNNVYAKKEA